MESIGNWGPSPLGDHPCGSALSLTRTTSSEHPVSADFEALFLVNYQAVFRLAYRIAGTREEAEDLAQETFLRLHGSPKVWQDQDDAGRLRGWLFTVVTNLAYNSLRGQGRRQRRESAILGTTSGEAEPADIAEQTESRLAVRQALLKLDERQAKLLLLRHAGLSYKELAETLNVAPGSVGTLLARAESAFEKAFRAGDSL
jgi:RNA polymerase sigma-70 factor (ECF subfamily)